MVCRVVIVACAADDVCVDDDELDVKFDSEGRGQLEREDDDEFDDDFDDVDDESEAAQRALQRRGACCAVCCVASKELCTRQAAAAAEADVGEVRRAHSSAAAAMRAAEGAEAGNVIDFRCSIVSCVFCAVINVAQQRDSFVDRRPESDGNEFVRRAQRGGMQQERSRSDDGMSRGRTSFDRSSSAPFRGMGRDRDRGSGGARGGGGMSYRGGGSFARGGGTSSSFRARDRDFDDAPRRDRRRSDDFGDRSRSPRSDAGDRRSSFGGGRDARRSRSESPSRGSARSAFAPRGARGARGGGSRGAPRGSSRGFGGDRRGGARG
jgi:hypothetical protein